MKQAPSRALLHHGPIARMLKACNGDQLRQHVLPRGNCQRAIYAISSVWAYSSPRRHLPAGGPRTSNDRCLAAQFRSLALLDGDL